MSQGPESTPDRFDAAQLMDMLTDSGENLGVIVLPEAAASFVADGRSGGPDLPMWKVSGLEGAIKKLLLLESNLPDAPLLPLPLDLGALSPVVGVRYEETLLRAIETVIASVSSDDATEDDVDEWGPAIPDEKVAMLEQANLKLQVEHRRQELSASMSRTQAADLLGVSPQTVSEWVAQHKLVGLKDGREWRFPAWQFTPDNAEPVLPDLDRLVATFPGGEVSLSRWMNRPNDNFAGRTPAQEMARDSDHVIEIVETLAAT